MPLGRSHSIPMPQAPADTHPRLTRCLDAIAGRKVDRAPLHVPAIACSVASEILGRPAHTGTGSLRYGEVAAWADGEAAHADFEAQLIEDVVAIHRALDVDVLRMPWRMNERPDARIDEYTFRFGSESGEHTIWQYHPETADFSAVYESPRLVAPEVRLQRQLEKLEKIAADPLPVARAALVPAVDLWRKYGSEFMVRSVGAGIGVGYDPDDLELMVTEPDLFRRKTSLQADYAIAVGQALLESGMPPVMSGGGDLAGTQGPIYSPAMFRHMVLPGYVKALKELNRMGIHYFFCSDGNLWTLMDMLFGEAAIPGYGEMDRDATMTVAAVRAKFPKMVIWGNVSSSLLMDASVPEVREQARAALAESGGTGYFQGCSNAIVHGTPVENVLAMLEVR
jgi:hypothetical protein